MGNVPLRIRSPTASYPNESMIEQSTSLMSESRSPSRINAEDLGRQALVRLMLPLRGKLTLQPTRVAAAADEAHAQGGHDNEHQREGRGYQSLLRKGA